MTSSGLTDMDGQSQPGARMVDELSIGGDESPLRLIKKQLREHVDERSTESTTAALG